MSTPPAARLAVVATHGHCFDGAVSATILSQFLRQREPPSTSFSFVACSYGPGSNGVDPAVFKGDVNALLDFRYSQAPNLTWYFDHHATAFALDTDKQHFLSRPALSAFHDPTYGSCAKLIADTLQRVFGFHQPSLDDLIGWADIIDAARFPSAQEALRRDIPALRLATVLEHDGDSAMLRRIIPLLASQSLEEVASNKSIARRWKQLAKAQDAFLVRIRQRSQVLGPVVFADLTDEMRESVVKFATYALYPECLYSVIVSRGHSKCKVSVGFNPWAPQPRLHDISSLCARHGGGGHPVVGAVSLAHDAVELAKAVGADIARELSSM